MSRAWALIAALWVAVLSAACAGTPIYRGGDAARIEIRTEQFGCCYIEGSLHYARLEGPTSGEFALEDDVERQQDLSGPIVIGIHSLAIRPGRYRLVVWERVCDGMCLPDSLSEPGSFAEAEFEVEGGEIVPITVSFRLLDETTIETATSQ